MTLRKRLVVAGVAVLLITGMAFLAVALIQRQYVLGQVDARLAVLLADTKTLVATANRADEGNQAAVSILSEAYVGVLRADGRLRTVVAPLGDPQLVPRLWGNETGSGAVTRPTAGGSTDRVRLQVAPLDGGRSVVIAVTMAPVEAATTRLSIALGLAWAVVAIASIMVGYWVDRHGLTPIARVTQAATGFTASGGRTPVTVDVGDPATEAGQLGQAFNAMVATTAEAQEQLRRFVADASHELRTPLTTLQGYSALYAAGGLADSAAVADAMRRINAEATRMNGIVSDLLELASLGDHSTLQVQRFDLNTVVSDLAADLRVREPRRSVSVRASGAAIVTADEDRIRQALTALIENAVKYSEADTPIRLELTGDPSGVGVAVIDAGRGIAAEDLPRVFQRFYRTRASGTAGSGLGLAIVAAIVAAHGGTYGVESTPGVGSTFWVRLRSGDTE